jgi:AraC-like DNA-binding protein
MGRVASDAVPDDALGTGPFYAESAPSPALARWVECYWTSRGTVGAPRVNRVLPDGCADIIVDLSAAPYAFVVGPMRIAGVFDHVGRVDMFGVRFRPGAAAALLDAPLDALCDRHVPLDALWGRLAAELEESLASAPPAERVACTERLLTQRLARAGALARDADTVAQAVALMRRARGGAAVRDVAAALGVGERWLQRAFGHQVGYGPKMLGRVVRLQHAVRLLRERGEPRPWTTIAYDAGYADQAHLVREFRALAGITPAAYAAERRRVGFVQDEGGAST